MTTGAPGTTTPGRSVTSTVDLDVDTSRLAATENRYVVAEAEAFFGTTTVR